MDYKTLRDNFFFILGPNVIESREHCFTMVREIKNICDSLGIIFIFKVSFDKANRTSLESYRGPGLEEGIKILKDLKKELKINIITDIHETFQAKKIAEVADIIQIPAFLCRQTDLLKAAAETGKIIHVKKGQFCSSDVMHKCKEKILSFGNDKIILCERGNMYGYNDLIVDPRNLIWLKSTENLVTMDITHCLQQPSQKTSDGIVKSGGLRNLIPYMGKLAISLGVNGIFMEVHDNPDLSLCDAPTQFPLKNLKNYLKELSEIKNFFSSRERKKFTKKIAFIPARYNSLRLPGKPLLKINGKSIIQMVYEKVSQSKYIDGIIILTDDIKIKKEVNKFGGECEIIKEDCLNGTERIVKYIRKNPNCCDVVINIQGDEPYVNPNNIDMMIKSFTENNDNLTKCSTVHFKLDDQELTSRSTGKILVDNNNNVLYCSRNIIPGGKEKEINKNIEYYGHSGIFVFDKEYLLEKYLSEDTKYQLSEDIEWLKIIEQGYKINSILISNVEKSVDTQEDYEYLLKKYQNG